MPVAATQLGDALVSHEGTIRLASFGALFLIGAVVERLRPLRRPSARPAERRFHNLALFLVGVLVVRLVVPAGAVGAALWAEPRGYGVLVRLDLPAWLELVLALVVLDLAMWVQHVAMHRVPLLWRFHRVHHADVDLDVTSGVRFHPGEILLSLVYKVAVVVVLGPSAFAVILFEVILNGMSLLTHANVRIAPRLDRALRTVVVTPDMHRIHHSVRHEETDSNFGFAVAAWDRLFRTYRADPVGGQEGMTLGLDDLRAPRWAVRVGGMLRLPFRTG
ncbi:MAG: sterol desaturase family protein [Planctomycetota bacterium]